MSTERREHQRFKLKVPVEICPEDHETPFRGATTDLSLGGCYIESIFPFPVGTALEIKLQLDDTLLILATAVTCDPQFGNGIRFDKILPEDLEQLETFLNSVAQQEAAATTNK
jgi:c-di-GMP-binding flagellar brake protein YcgR